MQPKHRRWILIVVVYDMTRSLHMDAVKDSIVAALVAKLLDGKIKRK